MIYFVGILVSDNDRSNEGNIRKITRTKWLQFFFWGGLKILDGDTLKQWFHGLVFKNKND